MNSISKAPTTPKWVKILAVIFGVFLIIFIALHLSGRSLGDHSLPPIPKKEGASTP